MEYIVKNTEPIMTYLPSLLHRMDGASVKKAKRIIVDHGGVLKRIRRSRHWQLTCHVAALRKIVVMLITEYPEEMHFLINKINQQLAACEHLQETDVDRLHRLMEKNPNMTLVELIRLTGCTIAEVRAARFALQQF